MDDFKQDFGRLQAKVEQLSENHEQFLNTQTIILGKLDNISNELSSYKTILKVLKFIGLAIVAVATFNWTGLADLWSKLH